MPCAHRGSGASKSRHRDMGPARHRLVHRLPLVPLASAVALGPPCLQVVAPRLCPSLPSWDLSQMWPLEAGLPQQGQDVTQRPPYCKSGQGDPEPTSVFPATSHLLT